MYGFGDTLGLSRPCRQDAVLVTLLLTMLGVCFLPSSACAKYDGGAGTEASPYIIRTADQMYEIGNSPADWSRHFRLAANIDMNDVNEYAVESFKVIGTSTAQPFSGVFDGSNHEITDFKLTTTEPMYTGLFGCVGGEVKNLGLINPVVVAQGSEVGALVGYLDQGEVTGCYARSARVSGDDDVGGLVGRNSGRIFKSYSSGDVSGDAFVGGLVGLLTDGTVTTSYSKADVSGNRNVGGLVGKTSDEAAAVTHSYATGSVTGDSYVGGLVGQVERGAAYKSYSVGSVSGNQHVGGLTGYVRVLGRVSNSMWDTETSGQPTSGGGTGKTTAEMKTISTFTDQGWDF
ncbi:MAG: GLUG motif-containing protein, partial [Planctomycetota bacterium]